MIITIERRGVVSVGYGYDSAFTVNSESLIALLEQEVKRASPEVNYNGEFAGRVKIELEFLGDMKKEGDTANE